MVHWIFPEPERLDGLACSKKIKYHSHGIYSKSNVNLQATLYVNPPGEGRKVPMAHVGDELVHVIRGEVLFYLNDQECRLEEGGLMHCRSEALHSRVNPGRWESVLIIVNTPPNW
ncbi:MAG: cupin domain-containing protein [Thermodesulfobacteriota bacterium]